MQTLVVLCICDLFLHVHICEQIQSSLCRHICLPLYSSRLYRWWCIFFRCPTPCSPPFFHGVIESFNLFVNVLERLRCFFVSMLFEWWIYYCWRVCTVQLITQPDTCFALRILRHACSCQPSRLHEGRPTRFCCSPLYQIVGWPSSVGVFIFSRVHSVSSICFYQSYDITWWWSSPPFPWYAKLAHLM